MAYWISSKLKAAETLLQQIDQQAAESLGKGEKLRSDDQIGVDTSPFPRTPENRSLIKEQLKKSITNHTDTPNTAVISRSSSGNITNRSNDIDPNSSKLNSTSVLTDSDWTKLLSVPDKKVETGGTGVNRSGNGVSGIRGLRRDGKRPGNLGSGINLSVADNKRSEKGKKDGVPKNTRKSNVELENSANDGGDSNGREKINNVGDVTPRTSSVDLQTNRGELDWKDDSYLSIVLHDDNNNADGGRIVNHRGPNQELQYPDGSNSENHSLSKFPASVGGKLSLTTGFNDDEMVKNVVGGKRSVIGSRSSSSMKNVSPSPSEAHSSSDTDSSSSSDSESEREREERIKRRQQILAEKAAAKAVEAIRERENMIARLEGEKQSLEKILEERAKQQEEEASELQISMMEVMEAVEQEKQKHNSTRMEALARVAKLETANADLARSLGTIQKNLEVKVDLITELRQQIKLKEATQEALRRKMSSIGGDGNKAVASKGLEFELEMLEAEYSFLSDKVALLHEKAKTLETSIETTRSDIENPTEVEIELKQRLSQLTDHLIQKQTQVEALSSEKATLLFRIEAVLSLLDENKSTMDSSHFASTSSRDDLESGPWEFSNSKLKPLFKERIRSGKQHLGSLVRQLDSIFCAGAVFLRRNSTARTWSIVYFVCLHVWVIYILRSHSPVSDESTSGAVVSLQSINNTG